MSQIKAIIFDVGGVLVKETSKHLYKRLAEALGIDYQALYEFRSNYSKRLLLGKMRPEEFASLAEKKFMVENFLKEWEEAYLQLPINYELLELVKQLRRDYRVSIISNIISIQAKINYKRGLFNGFNPIVLSCDVGYAKPDKEIYRIALNRLNLNPEACVFIDDREANIQAAKELGISSILFKDKEQLEEELKDILNTERHNL